MKRFWHLPLLGGTLILSFLIMVLFTPFAGMGTGILVAFEFIGVMVSHLLALIIGLFLINQGKLKAWIVLFIALIPATLVVVSRVLYSYHVRL